MIFLSNNSVIPLKAKKAESFEVGFVLKFYHYQKLALAEITTFLPPAVMPEL
jgi:hypothetical protein